jgi:hypothetical protein
MDFFCETAGTRLHGELERDRAMLEADNSKMDDWFSGAPWPKKDEESGEEE